MKRSRKAVERRKLVAELDGLVRQIVFKRAGYTCEKCGNRGLLHAAHVLPKGRYRRLRFEPENVLCLCKPHHLYWAHKNPLDFSLWFNEKFPGRYEKLMVADAVSKKLDLKELAAGLRLEAEN